MHGLLPTDSISMHANEISTDAPQMSTETRNLDSVTPICSC